MKTKHRPTQPPDSSDALSETKGTNSTALALPSKGLERHDSLQAYIREVSRYPVLSHAEQQALALRYVEEGDLDAVAQLVTTNLRLVIKIAYEYRQAYRNILDLIQEGNIGLMQAVKKYDPYRGVKLSTYSAWWIRAYMLRFILNNWRLVKLGTTQAQRKLFFNLGKEKARLSAQGIDPTTEEIANQLNVRQQDVIQMERRLGAGDVSLDAPVNPHDGAAQSRIDLMPAPGSSIDDILAELEMGEKLTETIHEFGQTLKDKDAVIFNKRLIAEEPMTLQQLGDEFGVSRERVRQLEQRVQKKLKQFIQDQLGDNLVEAGY
jgi:RNA polymerase sigma-32 factor